MSWIALLIILSVFFGPFRAHWRNRDRDGWRGGYRGRQEIDPDRPARDRQREAQIEQLESRVAELESRLDYAERLLTNRRDSAPLLQPPQ